MIEEAENSHHAVVTCPQAYGLRQAMREYWLLPDEKQFAYCGPDWFLLLLDRCSPMQRDLVKLVLWQAWSTHNNITHQCGPMGIIDGVHALLSMRSSLVQIQEERSGGGGNGKLLGRALGSGRRHGKDSAAGSDVTKWEPPPEGWCKVNVDGSFVEANGEAGVGAIGRDSAGKVSSRR